MNIHLLPKFLQVELTYACNSRCAFCYNPTHEKQRDNKKLHAILVELDTYHLRHIQLIGGEVTVLKDLPHFLADLKNTKWRSIVTNGRIFREDIKGLIDEVYISLHGDKVAHEEITGVANSFEPITENIQKYVQWGIRVNSDTVLTRYNADKIYEIARRASDLGMECLYLNIFQPEGLGSQRPDFSPSISQIRTAIAQMIMARDEFGIEMYFGTSTPFCLDERLITENLAFRCGAGEWFGSVNPDGDFRICNHSTKEYGNVLLNPFNEIWHSRSIDEEYRNIDLKNGICDDCLFKSKCLGGCRIDESGEYRVDPIVSRDRDELLGKEQLDGLFEVYESNQFEVSYR